MNKTTSTGLSGTTLLQIAFIILKLCKVINWSWLWVLSPLWISSIIGIILIVIKLIVYKKTGLL